MSRANRSTGHLTRTPGVSAGADKAPGLSHCKCPYVECQQESSTGLTRTAREIMNLPLLLSEDADLEDTTFRNRDNTVYGMRTVLDKSPQLVPLTSRGKRRTPHTLASTVTEQGTEFWATIDSMTLDLPNIGSPLTELYQQRDERPCENRYTGAISVAAMLAISEQDHYFGGVLHQNLQEWTTKFHSLLLKMTPCPWPFQALWTMVHGNGRFSSLLRQVFDAGFLTANLL